MIAAAEIPSRPMLRYHGGKWRLAPWIISTFPAHRVYVEPYAGGASVLLKKERSHAEVYNDLDGEIVNLFRTARDRPDELLRAIELTPYARAEFDSAFAVAGDSLEQARRTLIRSFFGFGGNLTRPNRDGSAQRTGLRTYTKQNRRATPAADWRGWPYGAAACLARLQGVLIECRPALQVMIDHDGADSLHYVDPPYVHSTRGHDCGGSHRGYRHEMSDDDHRELARCLSSLRGGVVLSGYACPLYDRLFSRWQRVERPARADGARARTEVLWLRNIKRDRIC